MARRARSRSGRPPKAERQSSPGSWRDRLAMLLAFAIVAWLGSAFLLLRDTRFLQLLMPGPLASVHGAIENCSACHTKSGTGKLSWVQSVVNRDPHGDSQACLTCHKMPATAFNAHGASTETLQQSTSRLTKVAAEISAPSWARVQNAAFPTRRVIGRGLQCATCHQEHKGVNFKLSKISNEQCHACHVVKFDTFDGQHPEFESYPFKRRSRIIYDHAGHFGKHFPEVLKKESAKLTPATCSTCHDSRKDRRVMAVAPFEQTCSGCHLEQITGKERVSGPKGIAFLSLPGIDLQTLKKKNAPIGEWPDGSEAELTPFMKVMISRSERGRALIKTVDKLNLQDLSDASSDQIEAVTNLVWEIKRLFYALISGKASDVLGDLNIDCGAKLSASLVADLTASLPRDVVVGAQQQWLPSLGTEMANRQTTRDQEQGCLITTLGGWVTTMDSKLAVDAEAASAAAKPARFAEADPEAEAKAAPGAGSLRVDPLGRVKGRDDQAEAPKVDPAPPKKADTASADAASQGPPPAKGADQTDDLLNLTEEELRANARPGAPAVKGYTARAGRDGGVETISDEEPPRAAVRAGTGDAVQVAQADGAIRKPADQTDDLLNPTEDELRGVAPPSAGPAPKPAPANAAPPDGAARANPPAAPQPVSTAAAAPPAPRAAPVISIDSGVDPESWAEYGGWYRQDYAIFYRPTGHKDKFIYSWLYLTGPQAPKGDRSPASAVFDTLTSKDAQGSCVKCHSVDDIRKGRLVNFSPPKVETKLGRFTNFIHEPHFGVLENRGCLTCHSLEKGRPYLESYAQGNPGNFASNFGAVKRELCQTCHTSSMARQDCLLCHKYHVNGVATPIMSTKIPIE
jgi:hypothetical protein